MKTVSELLNVNFKLKIKSFFISDGKSKILIARQYIEMTHMQLVALNSLFIRMLSSKFPLSSNSFKSKTDRFISYRLNNFNDNGNSNEKTPVKTRDSFYFVLVTSVEYNIIEAELLLKSITRFILETINYKHEIHQKSFIELIKVNAFNIILGLDDMINPLLGNERLSMSKIASNLKMESIEEKVFIVERNKKIDRARDDLIKGMEDIDRLKYANRYKQNGISNEDIENSEREADLRESQKIIDEIARERIREQINQRQSIIEGLNLQRHFLNRLSGMRYQDRESDYLVNSCENIIQQMMIKEMKRMHYQGDTDNDYQHGAMGFFSGPKLIITPLQFYYSEQEEDNNDQQ